MASRDKESKKLIVPSCPYSEGENHNEIKYNIETYNNKIVADYARLDFLKIEMLNIFEYWQLLRDAVIYNAGQTEEGQKWLKRCWVHEQKEPDRKTLRRLFGPVGK